MKLTTKAMNSPMGLRVTFNTAPVTRFHIAAILPDPSDAYRVDVTITLPEGREEAWLEGTIAAFRKIQKGMSRTIRLNYENVMRFFNLDQLERIDKRNANFSMYIYGIPDKKMETMNAPKISVVSSAEFARMYGKNSRQRTTIEKGGTSN